MKARIDTNDNNFKKGCFVILKTTKSISDFLKITFNNGSRINAINNVAAAFVPPELENMSIARPKRKQKNNTGILSFLNG